MSIADAAGTAVRTANAVACLQTLRDHAQSMSISEIADRTRLSRPTVDAVLGDLSQRSPIAEDQTGLVSGAGRPARRFRFDPSAGYVVGIDAGPHTVRLQLSDLSGSVVVQTETALTGRLDARERVDALDGCLLAALDKIGAPITAVRAAGVGVPGILGHDQRIAQSLAVGDLIGYPLLDTLRDTWGCSVVVENDIKLAALAEHRLRTEDIPNLAFLQIGHRISLALIMNGQILQGSHRVAGELGSQRGMKWTQSSVRGQLRWRTGRGAKAVFERAESGDQEAAAEIEAFCAEIAPKIATIVLTVDPDLVVIGGGLSRAGEKFLRPLTTAVHHCLMTTEKPALASSLLVSDGAVCGALGTAFEQLSADIVGIPGVPPPWPAWRV